MSLDCAAEEIAEQVLFESGKALASGDFGRFAAYFCFPCVIETADSRTVIRHPGVLRGMFDDMQRYYRQMQVIDMVRTVVDARFLDSDTVGATHVTSMVHADGVSRRKPYPIYSVIRRQDPLDWKFQSSLYIILDCETHNAMLAPTTRSSEMSW
jgi:hypothetical protein